GSSPRFHEMSPMSHTDTTPYGLLALRAALGAMWIAHGLLKVFVFGVAGFAGFLGSLGLPAGLALPIIAAEIGGGVLILLGIYGRQVSLLLVPVMAGALMVHLPNGWLFSAPNGGWEYPAFLIVASIAHALAGDGALALRSAPLAFWRPAETARPRLA
ncbi:MAG: DoxX family protein, partial [Oceanibaculum sp.]